MRNIHAAAISVPSALALAIDAASADSSSPRLAAYYDRQMAIVDGKVYAWQGDRPARRLPIEGAVQVAVGAENHYVLDRRGQLHRFDGSRGRPTVLLDSVLRFAAGRTGVLALRPGGTLRWIPRGEGTGRRIAAGGIVAAAVGDGANYYVTESGALFVRGKAHRGQYGDGRLTATRTFVQTARNVARITAHTGHAILLTKNGEVMGTGGNVYGPVGRHGLGDKAVRWSLILTGARAIATGSSHSLAILFDGTLMAWGRGYGPDPVRVMAGVTGVAAGSRTTIATTRDGALWQWAPGEKPRRLKLE